MTDIWVASVPLTFIYSRLALTNAIRWPNASTVCIEWTPFDTCVSCCLFILLVILGCLWCAGWLIYISTAAELSNVCIRHAICIVALNVWWFCYLLTASYSEKMILLALDRNSTASWEHFSGSIVESFGWLSGNLSCQAEITLEVHSRSLFILIVQTSRGHHYHNGP